MKYEINIVETLSRIVEVEAESREEALEKIDEMYQAGDIVLGADDFFEYELWYA